MAKKTNRNTQNTVVVVQLRDGSWQWLLNDHQGNCVIGGEVYGSRKACMLGAKRVGMRMHKWVTSMGWVDSNSAPQQVDAKREVDPAPQPRRGLFGMRRG